MKLHAWFKSLVPQLIIEHLEARGCNWTTVEGASEASTRPIECYSLICLSSCSVIRGLALRCII